MDNQPPSVPSVQPASLTTHIYRNSTENIGKASGSKRSGWRRLKKEQLDLDKHSPLSSLSKRFSRVSCVTSPRVEGIDPETNREGQIRENYPCTKQNRMQDCTVSHFRQYGYSSNSHLDKTTGMPADSFFHLPHSHLTHSYIQRRFFNTRTSFVTLGKTRTQQYSKGENTLIFM